MNKYVNPENATFFFYLNFLVFIIHRANVTKEGTTNPKMGSKTQPRGACGIEITIQTRAKQLIKPIE